MMSGEWCGRRSEAGATVIRTVKWNYIDDSELPVSVVASYVHAQYKYPVNNNWRNTYL
jgi:hypothetical protein